MGRPPCCDKVGIKKGPWTPEEDIILVSYIQEHGPGNWRSVPTNTGLLRCSKSCRLRWTNYLRPGIKRGNFTPHEEGMIIHLQALLGNKWAAIASYLPQRTDNDIKNYWNTHLKKKLRKFQSGLDSMEAAQEASTTTSNSFMLKGTSSISEKSTSLDLSPNSSSTLTFNHQTTTSTAAAAATPYASSAENISRLLEGWMRPSSKIKNSSNNNEHITIKEKVVQTNEGNKSSVPETSLQGRSGDDGGSGGGDMMYHEELESILSFENMNNVAWNHKTSCDNAALKGSSSSDHQDKDCVIGENKKIKSDQINSSSSNNNNSPPLSFLEKWLLDESGTGQADEEESMELSPIF